MASLFSDDITELTTTTLRELGRMRWSQIATTLQEYHAYSRFLKRGQIDFEDGGYGVQWSLGVADTGTAERSSLYDTDNVRTADTMITANAPWAYVKAHWAMDVRVIHQNRGAARIVNMWEAQRIQALTDLAQLLETDFWSAPDASDEKKVRALRYYIVKNASQGFNGGTPTGFSDVAGVNTTTYPRWRNYTDIYTTISRTDLIRRLKRAVRQCHFMPPVKHPSYTSEKPRWALYTVDDVMQQVGELAEDQNQNIGPDLAKYENVVTVANMPFHWAPEIDSDTDDPVYGIDWSSFKPTVLRDEYLRETLEQGTATSHNMKVVWLDMTYCFKCFDRRRNFVVSTGAN